VLSVNSHALSPEQIEIFVDDKKVESHDDLVLLLRSTEKACGSVEAQMYASDPSSMKPIPAAAITAGSAQPRARKRAPPEPMHLPRFKTPFIPQETADGELYVRVYEGKEGNALVVLFSAPGELDTNCPVEIRIHSSCSNSDILETLDCDCHEQLLLARRRLKESGGVLIHLFQEGRSAGLFSKYMGMAAMHEKNLSTYAAYASMSLEPDSRTYDLAAIILDDLGVSSVVLLTNNPAKVNALTQKGFRVMRQPLFGRVTPKNFPYLFSKFSEGGHQLGEVFLTKDQRFFCQNTVAQRRFKRVWIFDADDTLWEDNLLYENFIRLFIDHLAKCTPEISRDVVRALIDRIEMETVKSIGYGPHGFESSLRKCWTLLSQEHNGQLTEPVELFESIVPTLSSVPKEVPRASLDTLASIRARGDGLILASHGPLQIQMGKICRSGLSRIFDALAVSPVKDEDTFNWIISSFSTPTSEFIVVGNDLEADIRPAVNLGLTAVHYRNPNNWQVANRTQLDQRLYTTINHLPQVLNIFSPVCNATKPSPALGVEIGEEPPTGTLGDLT
jgi:GTP cyclohydrolase II